MHTRDWSSALFAIALLLLLETEVGLSADECESPSYFSEDVWILTLDTPY